MASESELIFNLLNILAKKNRRVNNILEIFLLWGMINIIRYAFP